MLEAPARPLLPLLLLPTSTSAMSSHSQTTLAMCA
jgi:hypothetical protein